MVVAALELVGDVPAVARCAPIQASVLGDGDGDGDAGTLAKGFGALGDPVHLRLLNLLATSTDGGVRLRPGALEVLAAALRA